MTETPLWASDRKTILGVLSNDGYKLQELPEEFANDPEIVTAAMTQHGCVLENEPRGRHCSFQKR